MLYKIYWNDKKAFDEVKNINLPQFVHFITTFENETLYAIGITSSFDGLQYNELRMINEGFSY